VFAGKRPGEGEAVGVSPVSEPVVRYQSYTPAANTEGDVEAMSVWAGQSVGLVSTVRPAGEIVREISGQAQSIIRRLGQ
jgi:NAD(P)H-dependent flavin oxidoreductase YrpB (nitropropane dioxygenase family)